MFKISLTACKIPLPWRVFILKTLIAYGALITTNVSDHKYDFRFKGQGHVNLKYVYGS